MTLFAGCGDDDGPPIEDDMGPTVGDGGGTDGGPTPMECTADSDCDDGVDCTVGVCREDEVCAFAPRDPLCDDENPCTVNSCDETAGCQTSNAENGIACSDAGGADGTCMEGTCVSGCTSDEACADAFSCTGNTCDLETGICQEPTFDDAACDDGNACTVDTCGETGCSNAPAADDTECTIASGAAGTCADGTCVTGCTSDAECDDGVDCTTDSCNTDIGACSSVPVDASCDDGVACTNDVCSPATGCTAEPVNTACDDGISCTMDACDVSAGCIFTPMDLACDDSVDCTLDVCSESSDCSNTPENSACDDSNPCTANTCDASGGCGTTNVTGGTPCMDSAGANGLCDGSGSCQVECTSTADCDDGDACNGAETCDTSDGTCSLGAALDCNDGVDCTDDSCDAGSGCINAANDANCDDGNPCTSGSCDATGDCNQTNVADTTGCTVGGSSGQCQSGACVIGCTGDAECDDGVDCTADSCNLTTGTCENTGRNGMCDDGVACTVDRCQASGCVNLLRDNRCDDSNECTTNMCTASGCMDTNVVDGTTCDDAAGDAGLCVSGVCDVECTTDADCIAADGNACNGLETCSVNGQCQAGTPPDCDDSNACTTDSCDPASGCQNDPITCDDSTSCTTDGCNTSSGCEYTPMPTNCDDGNECTSEVCTSGAGCTNPNVVDGTSCMSGAGTCQAGACQLSNPTGFRVNQLVLEDPHIIADRGSSFGVGAICGDVTNNDLTISTLLGPETITNINDTLDDLINTDGDGDTFADLSFVLYFEDLDRTMDGATGPFRAVESECTLPDPGMCMPLAGGQNVVTTHTIRRSGSCTPASVTDNVDSMTWPDGENASVNINRPTAGMHGCFISGEADFTLSFVVEGEVIALPLQQTQIAGTFADASETTITDGVLVGFLPESEADMIEFDVSILTLNLGEQLLPEAGQCIGHDGRDDNDGVSGWWFMVNLTAEAPSSLSGY